MRGSGDECVLLYLHIRNNMCPINVFCLKVVARDRVIFCDGFVPVNVLRSFSDAKINSVDIALVGVCDIKLV